jgi:hypothetical protein
MANLRLLLPGMLICQVTDYFTAIGQKVAGDYATIAFDQILSVLGITGRLINTFGIADSIAQLLHIERRSHLTNEIAPFARHISESFSNRREIAGCFSHEALTALRQQLMNCQILASQLILDLLNGVDTGIKIKTLPACGFGHGVFGVLMGSGASGNEVAIMASAVRQRIPRAFPNAHIAAFNVELSNAQDLLQRAGRKMQGEKIRLSYMLANSDLLCLTERYAIILLPTGTHLVTRVAVRKITQLVSDGVFITVRWRAKTCRWKFESVIDARRAWFFVETQRTAMSLFKTSLLR